MNFYTKNSSSGGFFFAAFSRGCFAKVFCRFFVSWKLVRWWKCSRLYGKCVWSSISIRNLFSFRSSGLCLWVMLACDSKIWIWLTIGWLRHVSFIWRETTPSFDRRFVVFVMRLEYFTVNDESRRRIVRFAFAFATPPTQRQAVESGSTT